MKNRYIILLLLVFAGSNLKSQDPGKSGISKNSLYFEFGTNVIVSSTSINYERLVYRSKSDMLSLYGRAGFGGTAIFWGSAGWGGVTAVTLLTGNNNAHFEANAGLFTGWEGPALAPGSAGNLFYVPVLDFGFRYQKPGESFIFRAKAGTFGVGLGVGYAF